MTKNDKLTIDLYHASQHPGDMNDAKAISRFVYAFKVLLKTAYKKDAIFSSDDLKLDILDDTKSKPQLTLVIITENTEEEAYHHLKDKFGEENIFLVCFREDTYEKLKKSCSLKLVPMFYRKSNGSIFTFYDLSVSGTQENLLFLKVFDLIDTIYDSIPETRPENSQKETIFLALTDERLSQERNILKRELKRLGYHVTPDAKKLNGNLDSRLKQDIEKSKLSIQLILPGEISDTNNALSSRQNELVLDRHKTSRDFSRIVWIAKPENDLDRESIKTLRENPGELQGVEVLQNSIETLRGLLKHKLNNNHHLVNHKKSSPSSTKCNLYFLYDKIDEKSALNLIDKLKISGCNLLKPIFKGDFYTLRNHHIHYLQEADMMVVYAEKVNSLWLQMKFLEILKSPGMGRTKKWLDRIIFLNSNQNIDWMTQKHESVTILENDINKLAKRIESVKKMLSHEGSI